MWAPQIILATVYTMYKKNIGFGRIWLSLLMAVLQELLIAGRDAGTGAKIEALIRTKVPK